MGSMLVDVDRRGSREVRARFEFKKGIAAGHGGEEEETE